jgi:hypothetical protein
VLGPVAVGGRFVAYTVQDCCGAYGDEYFTLRVIDMRTRRIRESRAAGSPGVYNATVTAVVVRRTGSAAWLWRRQAHGTAETWTVSRSPRCGSPATLAAGPDVDPETLRRDGSRVVWRQGGVAHRAGLC